MIKKRLVGLLSHAKKYIIYNVIWQWIALLSQIAAVFTIASMAERVLRESIKAENIRNAVLILAVVIVIRFVCEKIGGEGFLSGKRRCKTDSAGKIYEKLLETGCFL